ncbi:MAG: prohibitin family protein [Planctomycetes bacterium]|nr:prohibitin family protein [Planctomycetota bacterium]
MAEIPDNAMVWGDRAIKEDKLGSAALMAAGAKKYTKKLIWAVIILALLVIILPRSIIFVPQGCGGVLWLRLLGGTVHQPALGESLHIICPWDIISIVDLRVRDFRIDYATLSNDGLPVKVMTSLRYRVVGEQLSHLYQDYGDHYEGVLIGPVIGSITREVISRYRADELYAFARRRLEVEIKENVSDHLDFGIGDGVPRRGPDIKDGYVQVLEISVLEITLPTSVTSAIEHKMEQDQVAQEYEFRLRRETMEAQRKDVEVQGIENYQRVAATPWFRDYMKLIEIQSNYKIADSANAKLVFMANSGMPTNTVLSISEPTGPKPAGSTEPAAPKGSDKSEPPVKPEPAAK